MSGTTTNLTTKPALACAVEDAAAPGSAGKAAGAPPRLRNNASAKSTRSAAAPASSAMHGRRELNGLERLQ
jgi:hypothetical protein